MVHRPPQLTIVGSSVGKPTLTQEQASYLLEVLSTPNLVVPVGNIKKLRLAADTAETLGFIAGTETASDTDERERG